LRLGALLVGLATILAPVSAGAQPAGALDRFEPAPASDAFFSAPSADVTGVLAPAIGLTLSYAHNPLVLRTTSGNGEPVRWVDHQLVLHTLLSMELFERVKLEMDLPVTLSEGGTSGTLGGIAVTAPAGTKVNDLRVGGRVALLHQDGWLPAVGLSFSVWAPTGDAEAFTGSPATRYAPSLIVGATYRRVVWSAFVGRRFQSETSSALLGSQIYGGASAALRFAGLQIGPEFYISGGTGDKVLGLVRDAASAEVLLGAHYRIGPFIAGVAGGPGLGRGPGTPNARVIGSLAYAPEFGSHDKPLPPPPVKPKPDTDPADGQGTNKPRSKPSSDLDGDGVLDAEDACPQIVGDPSPTAKRRGCPPDRDGDGIFDVDDRCPDKPGVESSDPAKNGCPADTDGDGIIDAEDACPLERGKPSSDPKANGCPTAVRVEGTQIVILQQVNFATNKDEIKADSFGLLGQVAAVLKDHPEIARVAVDGHTDSVGSEKSNLNLSQRRAVAVVKWLTDHGVDARRLEARGFGPRRPIADNKSEPGRAKNRRVEFLIRKRTPDGEAGWIDGPID
jgi:outer membrane protein OmpA-like peptidoglycan-associated protein